MLSEVERYAALAAMGTRWWVPRYQLPAAKPSVSCHWPIPEAAPHHGAEAAMAAAGLEVPSADANIHRPPAGAAPAARVESLDDAAASALNDANVTPRLMVAPKTEAAEGVVEGSVEKGSFEKGAFEKDIVEDVEPMAVEVWAMNNRWLWVVELDEPTLAHDPQRLSLLSAIARALHPQRIGLVAQYTLNWPVAGVPVLRGDQRELADALTAYLTGPQFSPFEPPGVMTFGERLGALLDQDRLGRPCFRGPSLSRLLHSPETKAQLWQRAQQGLSAAFAANEVVMEA